MGWAVGSRLWCKGELKTDFTSSVRRLVPANDARGDQILTTDRETLAEFANNPALGISPWFCLCHRVCVFQTLRANKTHELLSNRDAFKQCKHTPENNLGLKNSSMENASGD